MWRQGSTKAISLCGATSSNSGCAFRQINRASYDHNHVANSSCRLYSSTMMSWGYGADGQLGLGDCSSEVYFPRKVSLPFNDAFILDVGAGVAHSVALVSYVPRAHELADWRPNGKIYTWGSNFFGQVGQDENFSGMVFQHDEDEEDEQPSPRLLAPVKEKVFKGIACGMFHNLALSVGDNDCETSVYVWGGGVLGLGDDINDATPRVIDCLSNKGVEGVGCMGYSSIAFNSKSLYVWGYFNGENSAEYETYSPGVCKVVTPMEVPFLSQPSCHIENVGCGLWHSIVVVKDESRNIQSRLFTLGSNSKGHSHDEKPLCPFYAKEAAVYDPQKDSVIFDNNSMLTSDYAHANSSERDFYKRLIAITELDVPKEFQGLSIKCVDAGDGFSAVLLEDGTVWTWGCNERGQLGRSVGHGAADEIGKVKFPAGKKPVNIACGNAHILAFTDDGSVYGWGSKDGLNFAFPLDAEAVRKSESKSSERGGFFGSWKNVFKGTRSTSNGTRMIEDAREPKFMFDTKDFHSPIKVENVEASTSSAECGSERSQLCVQGAQKHSVLAAGYDFNLLSI
eukprot:Nk52_evm22s2657 gene=Nk52_evmTU22s2657